MSEAYFITSYIGMFATMNYHHRDYEAPALVNAIDIQWAIMDQGGGSPGSTQAAPFPLPPGNPTNLVITNAGQVGQNPILSWDPPILAESFNIYRKVGTGSWELWDSVDDVATYTDTYITINNPNVDQNFLYKVTAFNSIGESGNSNQVSTWGSGFEKQAVINPKLFSLNQNFPNPFNPVTQIKYQIPKSTHVTLVIYNISGQEVARLVDEQQSAGFYSIKWDASHLSSGTYIYKLIAGNFVETKKMILIK